MDFISLKILDRFQRLFEKMGIDYEIMRAILKTKLILDTRRAPVIEQKNKQKDSEKKLSVKRIFFTSFLWGDVIILYIFYKG